MPSRHNTMMNPTIEDLLSKVDSKFTLVTLGSMRARQINSYFNQLGEGLGSAVPPQVTSLARKPLSIAFEEISADKIVGVHPEPEVELEVVRLALAADLPLLAICRGMQILNVALGGDLVQHIGSDDHWFQHHPVTVDAHSRIASATRTERPAACHSVHHQSIGRLGNGLALVGAADDGMPEAIEVDGASWAVAVQWHPEDSAATDAEQQGLFDSLVRESVGR